jgi:hypothetical protein
LRSLTVSSKTLTTITGMGAKRSIKKTSIQKIKNSPKKGMINRLLTRKRLGN